MPRIASTKCWLRVLDVLYEAWMYAWVPILPLYADWLDPGSTVTAVAVVVAGLVLGPALEVLAGAWADRVGGRRAFVGAALLGLASSTLWTLLPLAHSMTGLFAVLLLFAVCAATGSEAVVSGAFETWFDETPGEDARVMPVTAEPLSVDLLRRRSFSGLEWRRHLSGLIASGVGLWLLYAFTRQCPRPSDVRLTDLPYSPFAAASVAITVAFFLAASLREHSGRQMAVGGSGLTGTIDALRPGWEMIAASRRLPAVAAMYALNWTVIQIGAFVVPFVLWTSLGRGSDAALSLVVVLVAVRGGRALGSSLGSGLVCSEWDDRLIVVAALAIQALGFVVLAVSVDSLAESAGALDASTHRSVVLQVAAGAATFAISVGNGLAKPSLEVLRQAHAPAEIKSSLFSYMALVASALAAVTIACGHLVALFFWADDLPSVVLGFGFVACTIVAVLVRFGTGLWLDEGAWRRLRRKYRTVVLLTTVGVVVVGAFHFLVGRDLEIVRAVLSLGEHCVEADLAAQEFWSTYAVSMSRVSVSTVILVISGVFLLVCHCLLLRLNMIGMTRVWKFSPRTHNGGERERRANAVLARLREELGGHGTAEIVNQESTSKYAHLIRCKSLSAEAAARCSDVIWLGGTAGGVSGSGFVGYVVVEHNPG